MITAAGTDDFLYAPVVLPEGAVVTGFHATLWDDSPNSLRVSLRRVDNLGSFATMAFVETTGAVAAVVQYSDTTISVGAIDNVNASYVVEVHDPIGTWESQGFNLRLQSVRIQYRLEP